MTDDDYSRWAETLGTVAVAFSRDLDQATIDLYFKALKDVPFELLRLAAADIVRYEERWPTPAKWRKVVDECQGRRAEGGFRQIDQRLLPAPIFDQVTQEWVHTYYCYTCRDTGWRPGCGCTADQIVTLLDLPQVVGATTGLGRCKLHGGVEAHGMTYPQGVKPCECRPANPVFNKHHPATKLHYSKLRPATRRRADAE